MSNRVPDPASGHRKEHLLINSNLLLLLFVGQYDPTRIKRFKRTDQFTMEDFELLVEYIKQFREVVTTLSILTEVSNLLGQLPENLKYLFWQHFGRGLKNLNEHYTRSQELGGEKSFSRLGLTDTAILKAANETCRVLTDDFRLAQYLIGHNIDVINFNHLRTPD